MSKKIPEIFYKYRSFDNETLEMLAKNQVYFASPRDFNDPFDCSAQENMHSNFREEMAKVKASQEMRIRSELLTREQIQRVRERIDQDSEMIESRREIAGALSELDELGILSLTARNDSILMWSHYADFHRGFCIGFVNNLDMREAAIREVIYTKARNTNFLFNFFTSIAPTEVNFEEELMKEHFLTKYIDWEYEKEWRAIAAPARSIGTYSDKSIDRIIFGLKMPQENRERIKDILKGKNVNFFEAIKSVEDFAIEIKPINTLSIG